MTNIDRYIALNLTSDVIGKITWDAIIIHDVIKDGSEAHINRIPTCTVLNNYITVVS